MTEYERGWWECFNLFAIDIIYYKKNITILDNVIEYADLDTKDIENVIASGYVSTITSKYLTEYLKKVK